MGQFSWLTKDGEQICIGQKVWMAYKMPDGEVKLAKEEKYEGYGEFGGLDYFVQVFKMNNGKILNQRNWWTDEYREIGIDLAFGDIQVKERLIYPQLFTHEPTINEIENIDWFEPNENDPNQGWVVDED